MDDVVSVSMAIFTVLSVLPAVEGIPLGLKWGDIFPAYPRLHPRAGSISSSISGSSRSKGSSGSTSSSSRPSYNSCARFGQCAWKDWWRIFLISLAAILGLGLLIFIGSILSDACSERSRRRSVRATGGASKKGEEGLGGESGVGGPSAEMEAEGLDEAGLAAMLKRQREELRMAEQPFSKRLAQSDANTDKPASRPTSTSESSSSESTTVHAAPPYGAESRSSTETEGKSPTNGHNNSVDATTAQPAVSWEDALSKAHHDAHDGSNRRNGPDKALDAGADESANAVAATRASGGNTARGDGDAAVKADKQVKG